MKPYANYTESKIKYAMHHNIEFLYDPHDLNTMEPRHPYYYKVYAALNLMTGNNTKIRSEVDWIVFIDADAYVSEYEIPLHSLIYTAQDYAMQYDDNIPCEFIIQDSGLVLNTGFWMIRNTSTALSLLHDWINEIESSDNDVMWTDEQGCLQNMVLKKAINMTHNSIIYHNECWRDGIMLQRNKCWLRYMIKINLHSDSRKVGPFCLLPWNNGIPSRHHSRESTKFTGELIHHKKGLSYDIIHHSSVLQYDHIQQYIIIPDGSIVKNTLNTRVKRTLYLIQNQTLHPFPDWHTFVAMGYDVDMLVYLDDDAFKRLPIGPSLPSI